MPPGYGYLTRHLCTGRLTLGEAVQTTNRRVLVLENEEKTWLRAKNTYMFRPRQPQRTKDRHSRCHYKRNSGSTSAGTNNPTRSGGLRSDRRPTNGTLLPAPAAATTTTPTPGGRTVAVMASGRTLLQPCPRPRRRSRGEDKYKESEARTRMVAVIPSATGTSRAASTSAPTTGAVSPPADPHSDPPGRVGHRPPRGGAIPVQRQDRPRTRTPP
jgi:hypothetical protein